MDDYSYFGVFSNFWIVVNVGILVVFLWLMFKLAEWLNKRFKP